MLKLGAPFVCKAEVLLKNGFSVHKVNASIAAVDCQHSSNSILEVLNEAVTVTCDSLQVKLANKIHVTELGPHVEAFACFALLTVLLHIHEHHSKVGNWSPKKKGSNYGQFAAAVLFRKTTIFLLLVTGVKVVFFASFIFALLTCVSASYQHLASLSADGRKSNKSKVSNSWRRRSLQRSSWYCWDIKTYFMRCARKRIARQV
jgi:hypothetical protein